MGLRIRAWTLQTKQMISSKFGGTAIQRVACNNLRSHLAGMVYDALPMKVIHHSYGSEVFG
jgi:hypothetical protein